MAIPVIRLNLAPAPSLWRQKHLLIGWLFVGIGALSLCLIGFLSWTFYHEANQKGQEADKFSREARNDSAEHLKILNSLRSIDVQKELPRWKLAERILLEKSSPWSRLFAELERSLVQDVRIRNLSRTKGNDQGTTVKLKGEARSPQAEGDFIESLQDNAYFDPVVLDRETERQGGGMEFEIVLGVSSAPPAYEALPEYRPDPRQPKNARRETDMESPSPKGPGKPKEAPKPVEAKRPPGNANIRPGSPKPPANTSILEASPAPPAPIRNFRQSSRLGRAGKRLPPENAENATSEVEP